MPELLAIDYIRRLPYRYWYSSWTEDAEHPGGVRYKLLSARTGPTGPIELVVATEDRNGTQAVVDRTEASSPAAFEKTVAVYVDGLADSLKVTFFAIDLTRCRTSDDTKRILGDAGWYA